MRFATIVALQTPRLVQLDRDDTAIPLDTDSHLVLRFIHVQEFSGNDSHCPIKDWLHLALFGHHNLAVFGILKGRSLVEKVTEGLFPQGVLVTTFLAALFGSRQMKGAITTSTAKVAIGAETSRIESGVDIPLPLSSDLCISTKTVVGDVHVHVVVDASFHGDERLGSVLDGLDGGLVDVHLVLTVDFVGRENQGLLKDGNLSGSGHGVFVSVQVDLAVVILVNMTSALVGEVGQDGLGDSGGRGHGGGEEGDEGDGGVVHDDEVEGGR
jgi:hypothetical protein